MEKKLYILAGILAVLLALTMVKGLIAREPELAIEEEMEVKQPCEEFLLSRVSRVEIYAGVRPDKKIILSLGQEGWVLESHNGAPANRDKVEELLAALKDLSGPLRRVEETDLKDFYLAEEPDASLLSRTDFHKDHFALHRLVAKLKYGGEYLGSLSAKSQNELKGGQVPETLRRLLGSKGYVVSKNASVAPSGEGRWLIEEEGVTCHVVAHTVANELRWKVYIAEPLAEYLRSKLAKYALELLEGYDPDNFPGYFARHVLNMAERNRELRDHLGQVSLLLKEDAIVFLEKYLIAPEKPDRMLSATLILSELLKSVVGKELNSIISSEFIYSEHRFPAIPEGVREIAEQKSARAYVNRLLLEAAYPNEIAESHRPIHILIYSANTSAPSYHLLVGKKVASGTNALASCFVRSQAVKDMVHEVNKDLRGMMMAYGEKEFLDGLPVFPWLAKVVTLNRGETEKINYISLKYPDKEITFTRMGSGAWQAKPQGFKLKDNAVYYLLAQINSFDAMDVVTNAPPPQWDFSLEFSTPERKNIVLGSLPKPGGDGYCMRPERPHIIYKVWSGKFSGIFGKGSDFFDLPVLRVESSQIEDLTLTTPEGSVMLVADGGWHSPTLPLQVKKEAVDRIAQALSYLAMEDYTLERDVGLDLSPHRLLVRLKDGREAVVEIGVPSPVIKGYYARFGGQEITGVLNASSINQIFPSWSELFESNEFKRR